MTQTAGADDTRFLPLAANVRKELALLLRDLDEGDSVLIALAGHGVQFRGEDESYFCPADARLADKSTLIPLSAVYKALESSGAGLKLLLVDACRNDPQSENSRARSVVSLESVTRPQVLKPPGGVVAFFSCSEGEKAFEHTDLKHGVFFYYVIEALRGSAVGGDEREILVPDLEKYVKRHVRDFVREKYGVRQMPELQGTTRGLVPLVTLDRARPPDVTLPRPAARPEAPKSLPNSIGMKLVLIPAGEFLMGSPDSDKDANDNEKPQHRVRITRPFYLGAYEVTQEEYETVMGRNPSSFSAQGDGKSRVSGQDTRRHPVEHVSWNDAIQFCNKLSEREGLKPYYQSGAGQQSVSEGFHLPTEAEWEYACRAGTTTRYSSGDDEKNLGEHAWYPGNSAGKTHLVGQKLPNAFGLYDMHGNVLEWCGDWYDDRYYANTTVVDPAGPAQGTKRVLRGGCVWVDPSEARSANRVGVSPADRKGPMGFRVARAVSSR
jgi:formylglycine-generating enzyme required for sulfatase activity